MRTVSGRLPAYFIPLDDIRKYCMKEHAEASMHLYLLSTYSFVLRLNLLFWNYKIESPENETALVHIPVLARESLPRQLYFTLTNQSNQQPRSQGLSSLPPLVVGRKTLVAAGHVTTQNLGGKKICWVGGVAECFVWLM